MIVNIEAANRIIIILINYRCSIASVLSSLSHCVCRVGAHLYMIMRTADAISITMHPDRLAHAPALASARARANSHPETRRFAQHTVKWIG